MQSCCQTWWLPFYHRLSASIRSVFKLIAIWLKTQIFQAQESSTLMNKILSTTKDPRLKEICRDFLLKNSQRSKKINCGFFDVDWTLLFMVHFNEILFKFWKIFVLDYFCDDHIFGYYSSVGINFKVCILGSYLMDSLVWSMWNSPPNSHQINLWHSNFTWHVNFYKLVFQ